MSHASQATRARLFVALDLPGELSEELCGWARAAVRAAGLHGARLLAEETLHLTLCFLGTRSVAEIDPLCDAVQAAAGTLGQTSLGAPLWLPRRRPRALAVEVHDDERTLSVLHRELLGELAAAGLAPDDPGHHGGARPLRPHVTVARLGRGAAPRRRELPPTPQRSFLAERLTLYRSHLAPEGASYEQLASFATLPLGAGH